MGKSFLGDIAVDDIAVKAGSCSITPGLCVLVLCNNLSFYSSFDVLINYDLITCSCV